MTDILKYTKKLFTVGVVATTIMWSLGVAALVPSVANAADTCPALVAGEMIKVKGMPAIYVLDNNLDYRYFSDGDVFKSWNADEAYGGYTYVSQECLMDVLDQPSEPPYHVFYRSGVDVVKYISSNQLYVVKAGNVLQPVTEEVAEALHPDYVVRTIGLSEWPYYTVLEDEMTEAAPYEGMLVDVDGTTYYVEADMTLREVTSEGMTANRFKAATYELDSTSGYSMGDDLDASEAELSDRLSGVSEEEGDTDLDEPAVEAGDLTVALAASTPESDYVYKNSTHNAFTKVNFTAGDEDVTIKSLKVKRTGSPASDSAFTGVNVLKEDNSLLSSSYKTLNSAHEATFTEDVVVPKNSTVTLTLVGKMANSTTYSGEVPTLSLVEVETDADLHASLPVEGNAMTINTTVTIGVATVSESPDLGTLTEEVGTTDVELLNVKISNDSGTGIDLQIDSMRFNNAGSADDADVENLELVVDGNVIAESTMVSNYVMFDLSDCSVCKILNGKNETFQLRGDIVGGSGRNLDFDIKKADDIMARDLLNDTYVTPSAAINSGRTITISRGTLNVSKTNTVTAGNIPEDTSDLELGSWNFKVAGEGITINGLRVDLDVTGTVSSSDFTSCKLVDEDGTNLTGATDGADDSTSTKDGYVTFTDSFSLPIGDNEVKLTCTLSSDAVAADTIQAAIDLSSDGDTAFDATGDVTGDTITRGTYALPGSQVDANLQTVTDLSLTVTTLKQPGAQTIAAGTSGHLYSTVRFDASDSSEDIKVTAFEFWIISDGTTAKPNELQNITFVVDGEELSVVKDGSTATATNEEISVSLSGDDQFVVPSGSAVNMEIYADLSAGATATGAHRLDIINTSAITAQGDVSGNSVTVTPDTATANNQTVGSAGGTVQVSLASDNPSAALLAAGTEATLAAFKFYATSTEDVELDYLYLTEVETDTNSTLYQDYDEIWFEDEAGNEISGTRMTPTSSKPKINFASDAFVVDIDDTDGQVLYLKAALAPIGSGYNGTAGDYVGYKIDAAADVVAKGDLTGSAAVEYLSTSNAPTGNTHYTYAAYPVFEKVSVSTNKLANGTMDLYKFTITANNGDIALNTFTFDFSTTVAKVTDLYVYDVTGTETVLNDTAGSAPLDVWATSGADWTTNWSAGEVTVSKNTPRTFVLRGNVSLAGTGASVTVRVAGDSSHLAVPTGATLMDSTEDIAGNDAHDDFIWSDKSAGDHATTTNDWTNGYLVSGLAASSSTAETISY